jgi:hypothetical protein
VLWLLGYLYFGFMYEVKIGLLRNVHELFVGSLSNANIHFLLEIDLG